MVFTEKQNPFARLDRLSLVRKRPLILVSLLAFFIKTRFCRAIAIGVVAVRFGWVFGGTSGGTRVRCSRRFLGRVQNVVGKRGTKSVRLLPSQRFNRIRLKLPPMPFSPNAWRGVLSASKGVITSEKDVLLDGWPGVEIRYKQDPGLEGRLQAFVVKDQIVNLVVTHPLGSIEPQGTTRFFGSVKLPSDIPKGELIQAGPELEKFDLDSSGFSAKVPKGVKSGPFKIGDGPTAVEMHRFAVAFINRVYMGVVFDPPSNASKNLDGDTTGKPAQAVNESIASLFGRTVTKTDSKKSVQGTAWLADFELGHGLVGHLETYIRNNHTYSLLGIVPSSMLSSTEVKDFFRFSDSSCEELKGKRVARKLATLDFSDRNVDQNALPGD